MPRYFQADETGAELFARISDNAYKRANFLGIGVAGSIIDMIIKSVTCTLTTQLIRGGSNSEKIDSLDLLLQHAQ